MGDDAEYYIEQLEKEAWLRRLSENAELNRDNRDLLCWIDGCPTEVWNWTPNCRIPGVFSDLRSAHEIGRDCFLASMTPEDWYDEDASPTETVGLHDIKIFDKLKFCLAATEREATYEVMVLTREDVTWLQGKAVQQKYFAKTLNEKLLAEMLEEMSSFIQSETQQDLFVFAREL